jgi:hypothetical protein
MFSKRGDHLDCGDWKPTWWGVAALALAIIVLAASMGYAGG